MTINVAFKGTVALSLSVEAEKKGTLDTTIQLGNENNPVECNSNIEIKPEELKELCHKVVTHIIKVVEKPKIQEAEKKEASNA